MLTFFRTLMKSFIFRIVLFGILLLSFALWGISDTITGGALGRGDLAKVGGVLISLSDYDRAYQQKAQSLRERGITEEQLRYYAVPQTVLADLVQRALLQAESEDLGIKVSKARIQQDIVATQAFQGSTGEFSSLVMRQALSSNGYTVPEYYQTRQEDLQIDTLLGLSFFGHHAPAIMQNEHYRFTRETRNFDYISLNLDSQKVTANLDAKTLKTYYDENQADFTQPERRTLRFIDIKLADISRAIKPNESDLRQYYQTNITNYSLEEQRWFQFIFFDNHDEAKKFAQNLKQSKKFHAHAKSLELEIIDIPAQSKAEIIDNILADAVFNASKAQSILGPIEGELGFYMIYVQEIKPKKVQNFRSVRAEIKARLVQEQAGEIYFNQLSQAEDASIAGVGLAEIASELGLNIQEITMIDGQGRQENGQFASNIPRYPNFLSEAFALNQGDSSYVIPVQQQAFFMVEAKNIQESFLPEYQNIESEIRKAWRNQEQTKIARDKLQKLKDQLQLGKKSLSRLAKEQDYALLQRKKVTRSAQNWSREISQILFQLKQSETYLVEGNNQMLLFQVTNIDIPNRIAAGEQKNYQNFLNNFNNHYAELIRGTHSANLRKKHKITVNEKLFEQILEQINGQ